MEKTVDIGALSQTLGSDKEAGHLQIKAYGSSTMSPRVTSSGFWVVIYGILSDWAYLLLRLQQPPLDSPCFFFLFLLLALGGLALAPILVFSTARERIKHPGSGLEAGFLASVVFSHS